MNEQYLMCFELATKLIGNFKFANLYDYLVIVDEIARRLYDQAPLIKGSSNDETKTSAETEAFFEAKAKLSQPKS